MRQRFYFWEKKLFIWNLIIILYFLEGIAVEIKLRFPATMVGNSIRQSFTNLVSSPLFTRRNRTRKHFNKTEIRSTVMSLLITSLIKREKNKQRKKKKKRKTYNKWIRSNKNTNHSQNIDI